MNRSTVIVGILGVVSGFVVGYLIGKKEAEHLAEEAYLDAADEKEVEHLAEEAYLDAADEKENSSTPVNEDEAVIDALKDFIKANYGCSSDDTEGESEHKSDDPCGEPDDTSEAYEEENVAQDEDPDWNAKESATPEEFEEYCLDRIGPGNSEDEVKRPYIISFDSYTDDKPDYAKFTCLFLSEDATLINEDEVVLDIYHTIGGMFMCEYMRNAYKNQNRAVFYIRNDAMSEDYEVLWTNRSYGKDYLSIDF